MKPSGRAVHVFARRWQLFLCAHSTAILFALLASFSLLLNSPALMDHYSQINPQDEAKYIYSGVELLKGEVRDLAWGPLVAFVYSPMYLLTKASPYHFFYQAFLGKLLILALLWTAFAVLADQLAGNRRPWIMAGLLFLGAPFGTLLDNSSDSLYVVLSTLALACSIRYYRGRTLRALLAGSSFLGLACLVRPDGFLLFAFFAVFFVSRQARNRLGLNHLPATLLPFVGVLFVYFMIAGASPLESLAGVARRSYFAFEQGQWTVTGGSWSDAELSAVALFGSGEENGYNAFIAIARHPREYMARLHAILGLLPGQLLRAYGKRLGVAILLFACLGFLDLVRSRQGALLLLLVGWSGTLLAYFVTFFREGYLLLALPTVLTLALMGVARLIEHDQSPREKVGVSLGLAAATVAFAASGKPAFVVAAVVLAFALWIRWLAQSSAQGQGLGLAGGLVFVCAGLILRGEYPFPNYPVLGDEPQERMIAQMSVLLPANARVASSTPLAPLAADMVWVSAPKLRTSDQLQTWIADQEVDALFVDPSLSADAETWLIIEGGVGSRFLRAYSELNGSYALLVVSPDSLPQ